MTAVENDNDKLKDTMREMVDDYTRQLELRDETIQRLESAQPNQSAVKREIQDLENELRLVRDKNVKLNREMDSLQNGNSNSNMRVNQLQDEIHSLNMALQDKERLIDQANAQVSQAKRDTQNELG